MLVHVTIDPDACIGSGECVAIDPEAVELDTHGSAHLLVEQLDEKRAERLCDACPMSAISIQAR
jgi:ferredoxin